MKKFEVNSLIHGNLGITQFEGEHLYLEKAECSAGVTLYKVYSFADFVAILKVYRSPIFSDCFVDYVYRAGACGRLAANQMQKLFEALNKVHIVSRVIVEDDMPVVYSDYLHANRGYFYD
jgi:hypothetical protein